MAFLSLTKPIEHVASVKNLQDGHPVFLIVGDDGSHLVVKQEATKDEANLRRNFLAMTMASPQARSVILTPSEVDALRMVVQRRRNWMPRGGGDLTPHEAALDTALVQGGTWFKMKEAEGFVNLEGVAKQQLEGDKSGVRSMAKALNNSGGLEALGKIVAADMFNGNGDRFVPKTDDRVRVHVMANGKDNAFEVNALVNVGNVMAAMSGSKLKVIGLDSWDPWGNGKNMNDPPAIWLGKILAPDQEAERLEFAVDICGDLNLLLGARHRRFDFLQQTRLNSDAALRVAKGMNKMRKLLIDKMVASGKRPNPPAGLAARLAIVRGR